MRRPGEAVAQACRQPRVGLTVHRNGICDAAGTLFSALWHSDLVERHAGEVRRPDAADSPASGQPGQGVAPRSCAPQPSARPTAWRQSNTCSSRRQPFGPERAGVAPRTTRRAGSADASPGRPAATGPRPAAPTSAASAATCSPERMSLTWSPAAPSRPPPEEPHERDARAGRRAGSACRTSPRSARPRRGSRARAARPRPRRTRSRASSLRHRDEHGARHRPRRADQARRQQARHEPGDADRQPDARVGRRAVGRERVVAAARADRAELLVPDEHRLVDRARVVVEPARDLQVGDDDARRALAPRRATSAPSSASPSSSSS